VAGYRRVCFSKPTACWEASQKQSGYAIRQAYEIRSAVTGETRATLQVKIVQALELPVTPGTSTKIKDPKEETGCKS
jgi:hypothetical protein